MVVKGTRGNEGAERSGVHDKEEWTKDRALGTPQEDVCQEDRSVTHLTRKGRDERYLTYYLLHSANSSSRCSTRVQNNFVSSYDVNKALVARHSRSHLVVSASVGCS